MTSPSEHRVEWPTHAEAACWVEALHPVIAYLPTEIGEADRDKLQRLATKLRAEDRALDRHAPFEHAVEPGLGPWPSLFIEDHSGIALFETAGNVTYSYRALMLAGDGDLAMIGGARCRPFESYCREHLDLGQVELLIPDEVSRPRSLAGRCVEDEAMLDRAARKARVAGGLNVFPYMGTGGVWRLAVEIAKRARVDVRVAAPRPNLTQRVNDKLWFARRVGEALGQSALPPALPVHGLAALSARVAGLARDYPSVAVKIPDSASSAGNFVLSAGDLKGLSIRAIRGRLQRLLRRTGWHGSFPLMVTAWESPVIASPSVQLWIPRQDQGDPVVEGLFDQTLVGLAGEFSGAEPTGLQEEWQQRLAAEAGRLAFLFQQLGYFGRCSFDAIVAKDRASEMRVHWIECNGRWGGVSIPMTLANRLYGDWRSRPFVVVERSHMDLRTKAFAAVLHDLGDDLYAPGRSEVGAIILSPSPIELGAGFEVMVVGASLSDARQRAGRIADRLSS